MEQNKARNKNIFNMKGQSLVEVTVALSILAVVFMAVVTLAANAVGLMINSRQRTEATALIQQGMEEIKSLPSSQCQTGLEYLVATPERDITSLLSPLPSDFSEYTRTAMLKNPDPALGIPATDYGQVEVTVSWNAKIGGASNMVNKQIMKRK